MNVQVNSRCEHDAHSALRVRIKQERLKTFIPGRLISCVTLSMLTRDCIPK